MTWFGRSLRLRLAILILLPLLVVSAIAILWRFVDARSTTEDIFDRNLVMLNLAVSRDVAYSGGDTLSETTAKLFKEATGGAVFYHVYGPDGSFVTGYSSPPIRGANVVLEPNTPLLFDAIHQGQPVRAASLAERVEIDGIRGMSVITVWQPLQPRTQFAQTLAFQALALAFVLILTVATMVFFGIRLGLRPLEQLEAAIQKRSTTDLRPIVRQIPIEAQGIVQRLNGLFIKLTEAHTAKERLISNAAHQLRNPVAAIHNMAQAIENSNNLKDSKKRASELLTETRQTMRLTEQMLSLEKIQGKDPLVVKTDLSNFLQDFAARIGPKVLHADVAFEVDLPFQDEVADIDPTLFGEAMTNLVENALIHAGENLTLIRLRLQSTTSGFCISVENDGKDIPHSKTEQIFERFTQGGEGRGAGLGLAIVQEIVDAHSGTLVLKQTPSTRFEIWLDKHDTETLN